MILFLDIASHEGALALVDGDECVAFESLPSPVRDHELIPLVEAILSRVALRQAQDDNPRRSYECIDRIACVVGPGGFTSLRIAVSFANTLIDQLGIPACGVHLADLYASRCPTPNAPHPIWFHATKKDQVFVHQLTTGVETPYYGVSTDVVLMSVEEMLTTIPKGTQWCGELLPTQLETLQPLTLKEATLTPLEDVLPAFLETLNYEKKPLEPWYGRGW